ncbi:DUF2971 domain-containing protein [Cupriavidus gilardii]|nr:DUF2971 domain-containing protein [Cupriavidus gilardii]
MATLKVGKSLKDEDVLWRYLSLDKFIDLVESRTLFFTPLSWYSRTDPFEGYIPRAGMDAMASLSRKYRDQHLEEIEKLAQMLPEHAAPQLRKLRETVESHVPTMRELVKNISACLMVNCWCRSAHESEGMWALYSKGGVAIRTSVGALRSAVYVGEQNPVIHIGRVKYIDFADESLKPSDCVTEDGHLMGMIKRVAYGHEREVRMYVTRDRSKAGLELQEPAPMRIAVDVDRLLEAVVISPFAGESIDRSVRAICRWSGVNENVVLKSSLLDNCDYLLDVYQ